MEVNFFIPEYMKDFKCISSECNDSCCTGWEVNIDEETFNKYEESTGEFKNLVYGKYHRNPNIVDKSNYGYMNIKDGKCPFLNENKLCDIHKFKGEQDLSVTCKRYPRVYNIIDGIYEKSGVPSCEEVCLRAFLNKEKMQFVEVSDLVDEEAIQIGRILDSESFVGTESLIQYFWDIRINTINIMQDRNYSINKRFLILKKLYSQIEKIKKENVLKLEDYFENLEYEAFNIEDVYNEDNNLKNIIFSEEITNLIKSKSLIDLINNYKKYKSSEILKDDRLDKYDYIIENYLVNQIFKTVTPFNKGENILNSLNYLIHNYEVVKCYIEELTKVSNKNLDEEFLLKIIQGLSKDLEHNKEIRIALNLE